MESGGYGSSDISLQRIKFLAHSQSTLTHRTTLRGWACAVACVTVTAGAESCVRANVATPAVSHPSRQPDARDTTRIEHIFETEWGELHKD
ncbi:hypothetical protein B2J88_44825 [Rhodococcus sp. SRB_17]|nr:hypothetical protein [Rhodococcus sp. SRB_17]